MNNLFHFSVNNKLFLRILSILVILAGFHTLTTIKKGAFPALSFDIVQITTSYRGATPKEVEKLVTIPIEEEIKEVDGIDEMSSVSAENISVIIIKIDPDESDKRKVVNDIQRAVDKAKDIPEDADDPLVLELETKNEPILEISLSSETLSEMEIRDWALVLEDMLLDIPDIAKVDKSSLRDQEIWVEVDPAKLVPYYLSLEEVIDALREKNVTLAGGTIQEGNVDFTVRTLGEFETAEEIENVVIRANDVGNWIRVKDVATVRRTLEEPSKLHRTNGRNALNLVIIKKESGDILNMMDRLRSTLKDFSALKPAELHVNEINDFSYFVRRRLSILINNGMIGGTLIVILLLTFLRFSVALTNLFDLGLVFLASLTMVAALGVDINLISMLGFIMVLGMLCDDSIVVSENFYRLTESGMTPREAALNCVSPIWRPVLGTVTTTFAAFAPLLFMSGIIGKFIQQIPVVVMTALSISVVDSFFILPGHLAHHVKMKALSGKEKRGEHWFQNIAEGYAGILRKLLGRKYLVLAMIFFVFIGSLALALFGVKFILFSSEGIEQFFVRAEAPIGTSLEHTRELFRPLEKAVGSLPDTELEDYVTTIGLIQQDADDPYTSRVSHVGQIRVFLTPSQTRKRDAAKIIEEIRAKIKDAPGFERVYFDRVQPGPPVGKAIMVRVRGKEYGVLNEIAAKFQETLRTIPGVLDVRSDYEAGKDELRVIVDEQKAREAGLTLRRIAEGVRNAYEGGIATTIKTTEEEIDVRVKWKDGKHLPADSLKDVLVRNRFDQLVPVDRVASFTTEQGLSAIKHLDSERVVTVSADVDQSKTTSSKVNGILKKTFRDISREYPGYLVKYGGEEEDTQESMASLQRAFGFALLFIFMILALEFKSVAQTLAVMFAIPLGITGIIFTFFLHGKPLGFMSILGGVALTGVVVNASLIMVSFINGLRREGVSLTEAVVRGAKIRLRPILITSLTTAAGTMPMAYGIGGNDPFIRPLALAFTWGLILSSFLTLFVIPCFYAVAEDLGDKFLKITGRKRENGRV